MTGILITPADKAFSSCIKERAGWRCEFCGKPYPRGSRGLQCAHFFPRGDWSTRFEPLNCVALCFYHHQLLDSHHLAFVGWMKQHIEPHIDLLIEIHDNVDRGKSYRRTKGRGEIAKYYEHQLSALTALREEGEAGRLEFAAWF